MPAEPAPPRSSSTDRKRCTTGEFGRTSTQDRSASPRHDQAMVHSSDLQCRDPRDPQRPAEPTEDQRPRGISGPSSCPHIPRRPVGLVLRISTSLGSKAICAGRPNPDNSTGRAKRACEGLHLHQSPSKPNAQKVIGHGPRLRQRQRPNLAQRAHHRGWCGAPAHEVEHGGAVSRQNRRANTRWRRPEITLVPLTPAAWAGSVKVPLMPPARENLGHGGIGRHSTVDAVFQVGSRLGHGVHVPNLGREPIRRQPSGNAASRAVRSGQPVGPEDRWG